MENPHLPTVLTSLREIAKLESNVFELEVDGIIGDFVIKQVLRHDDEVRCFESCCVLCSLCRHVHTNVHR